MLRKPSDRELAQQVLSELRWDSVRNALEWDALVANEAHGNTLMIMADGKADDHVTHTISRSMEVSLEQTDEGADAALAIKSADGITALLRFRSPGQELD